MSNVLIIVIIGAVGVISGYLFGLLDGKVTSKLKDGQQEVQLVPEVSAMSVVFDLEHNIQVKMQGEPVKPEGLSVEQREILKKIVLQLRPYLVVPEQVAAPVAAAQPAAIDAMDVAEVVTVAAVPAPVPVSTPISAPVKPAIKVEPVSTNVLKSANYMLNKSNKPAVKEAVTMVEQIDEVLQAMIVDTPMMDRQIAMRDGPGHTVIVAVGGTDYVGVDSVPDPEVKELIHKAVAAWEKKYS